MAIAGRRHKHQPKIDERNRDRKQQKQENPKRGYMGSETSKRVIAPTSTRTRAEASARSKAGALLIVLTESTESTERRHDDSCFSSTFHRFICQSKVGRCEESRKRRTGAKRIVIPGDKSM
jgi:uncharacterized protein YlaI